MRDRAILLRYIFPNGLSPLIVQCTFVLAFAIISEASLSFLGAGVDPETPTWGNMLRDGQRAPPARLVAGLFPGIALVLTVLALNILGDGLRDALDPRSPGAMRGGKSAVGPARAAAFSEYAHLPDGEEELGHMMVKWRLRVVLRSSHWI